MKGGEERGREASKEGLKVTIYSVVMSSVADSKECELNCLARGHKFFLRLLPKVEDGTPCLSNPSKLCIDGKCQVSKIFEVDFL